MQKQKKPEAIASKALHEFWSKFHLFPFSIDKFIFRKWYIFLLTECVIILVFDVVLDLHKGIDLSALFVHGGHYYKHSLSLLKSDLENWIFISQGIALALVAIAFNRWCGRVERTFHNVCEKEHICSFYGESALIQEYLQYLKEYQGALMSKKRYIFVGLIMAFILLLIVMVVWPRIPTITANLGSDPFYCIGYMSRWLFLIICNGLFIGYCVATGIWAEGVTGWYISKLTMQFDLNVQPSHPDNCGGMRSLGAFCFDMTLPLLISAVFLGIYGIGLTFSVKNLSIFAVTANIFLLLFVLPLAFAVFFVPVWQIHLRMFEKKVEYEDAFSNDLATMEKRIQSTLRQGDLEQAKKAREEMELMQVLHPAKINYPVWPFDNRILFAFLSPQVVAFLSLIVGINQGGLVAQALKSLVALLMP